MDHADVSVGEQILVIAGGSLNAKVVGEFARRLGRSSGNPDDFYVAQAAQRLGVDAAHEADSKNCNLWFFQITFQSLPAPFGRQDLGREGSALSHQGIFPHELMGHVVDNRGRSSANDR